MGKIPRSCQPRKELRSGRCHFRLPSINFRNPDYAVDRRVEAVARVLDQDLCSLSRALEAATKFAVFGELSSLRYAIPTTKGAARE
jgi:hypothetical protein